MNDSYKITSRSRERFWKRLLLYIEKVLYRSDPEAGRRAVSIFASPIYGSSEVEWFVPSEIFGFKPQIRKLSEYDQNVQQEITQRLIGIIEDLRNRAMKAAEDPESAEQKVLISYLYDPYRFYKYGCALEFNPEEDIYVINDHDPIIAGWGLKDKSADSAAGQIFYKVHSCEPEQKIRSFTRSTAANRSRRWMQTELSLKLYSRRKKHSMRKKQRPPLSVLFQKIMSKVFRRTVPRMRPSAVPPRIPWNTVSSLPAGLMTHFTPKKMKTATAVTSVIKNLTTAEVPAGSAALFS